MIYRSSRGAALVETALTIGLALLLVLGTAQMALIGYTQVSADGAAFIAAHAAAADPSATPAAVANQIFSNILPSNITATTAPGANGFSVSKSVPGFSMIPGMASTYTVNGSDIELAPSPPPGGTPSFQFGATSTLFNYCYPGTTCSFPSNHSMYLAQTLIPGGNGVNGQFQEWGCHDGYFSSLTGAFPSTRPPSITAGSALDMTSAGTTEYNIYSWDSGTPCS